MRRTLRVAVVGLAIAGVVLVVMGTLRTGPTTATKQVNRLQPQAVRLQQMVTPRVVEKATTRPGRPAPARSAPARSVEPPLSLSIPSLSTSGPVIEHVAVQLTGPEKGLLSAPGDFHDLGWYMNGTTGVLVIDGHVGFAAGAGPLAYIGQLSAGQPVLLRFASGSRTYVVDSVQSVPKGSLPAAYFSPRYDGDVMLITCNYLSPFNDGHFADNVYVIASPQR